MNAESIKKYFQEMKLSNSIGHAYLFKNVIYDDIEHLIKEISEFCFFENSLLDFYNNPDIYIIEPEKNIIKKEKILELESQISKTSQINLNKLYIIKECEKLNSSAANSLLKTLEEPQNNVYAFLITSEIEMVIPTIKSRCQIINCEKFENSIENEFKNKALEYINMLEKNINDSIAYNYFELYKNLEKEELKEILCIIEKFYLDCLNKLYNVNLKIFDKNDEMIEYVCSNNDVNKITKKIKILNDNINLLKYNLNSNLFIDKILIEFRRIK